MVARKCAILRFSLALFTLAAIIGCAGLSGLPSSPNSLNADPQQAIVDAYIPHIGQWSEFQDQLGHHLFIHQETAPGFDGVTGIVWHYTKIDPRTNAMALGDDGLGYWCVGDSSSELYFGLTRAADTSWSSTHQEIKCGGLLISVQVSGPLGAYMVVPSHTGTTGAVTYSACGVPGFSWAPTTCAVPDVVGWQTDAFLMGGIAFSHQVEGPCVLKLGRCLGEELWGFKDGDLIRIEPIDAGNGPNVDPRLSMALVNRFWLNDPTR